ncbi:MAG: hypothetical protein ACRD8W_30660, partial [Nitrososphaeraceae archaeon]
MNKVTLSRTMYLGFAFFFAAILVPSTITGQVTYATTVTEDPGTYMTGQRIATYEEMGIDSLLTKYENNMLDPTVLINDIYDRIELNDANENNPILISRVSRADALERVDELNALRTSLPPGVNVSERY